MSLCLYVCGEERENPCISVSFFLFSVLHLRSLISAARFVVVNSRMGISAYSGLSGQVKWLVKTRFCWTRDSYSPITEYCSTLERQISTWRWNHRLIKDRRLTFKTDRTFRVSCPSDEREKERGLCPPSHFFYWVMGVKWPGRETDPSHQFSADVKNACNCTSTPPSRLLGLVIKLNTGQLYFSPYLVFPHF